MSLQSTSRRAIPLLVACALSIPHYSAAQFVAATPTASSVAAVDLPAPASSTREQSFTQEQLDQMLAPIALYPDALLSQVLMASTYPLEVVEAARWCTAHPAPTPVALSKAALSQPWDPSVKSLCSFPKLLDRMSRDLTWTEDLGEAIVGQQAQLMDAIQELRNRARNAGSLVGNAEQVVMTDAGIITIMPRDPQVIYVPTYDPTVVYGSWWWPAPPYYPAYWWTPGGIAWDWGIGVAAGIGLWGIFDWHHHMVNLDVVRYNRLYGLHLADAHWRFDPAHRAGVGFHRPALDHMYGSGEAARAREQFREHEPAFAARGPGEHAGRPEFGGGAFHGDGAFHGSGGSHGGESRR